MPMEKKGLVKLVEECGELTQIAAKKMAFFNTDEHPDGAGSVKRRLEDEIADVAAASDFVVEQFGLDKEYLIKRYEKKLALFRAWHADPNL